VLGLYHEKASILDGDGDSETDLSPQAWAIWKNAIDADPSLKGTIEKLPDVVYSRRAHEPARDTPEGVLLYLRTPQDYDALDADRRLSPEHACPPAHRAAPRTGPGRS
jgi:hypothetical protein